MVGVTAGVFIYWQSSSVLAINITLACIGVLIYGQVMLIGQVSAEIVMGIVVDKYNWDGGFMLLMVSVVLAIVFLSLTWNVYDRSKPESEDIS